MYMVLKAHSNWTVMNGISTDYRDLIKNAMSCKTRRNTAFKGGVLRYIDTSDIKMNLLCKYQIFFSFCTALMSPHRHKLCWFAQMTIYERTYVSWSILKSISNSIQGALSHLRVSYILKLIKQILIMPQSRFQTKQCLLTLVT